VYLRRKLRAPPPRHRSPRPPPRSLSPVPQDPCPATHCTRFSAARPPTTPRLCSDVFPSAPPRPPPPSPPRRRPSGKQTAGSSPASPPPTWCAIPLPTCRGTPAPCTSPLRAASRRSEIGSFTMYRSAPASTRSCSPPPRGPAWARTIIISPWCPTPPGSR